MTREELFDYIQNVNDPQKDYAKILSNLHFTHFHLMDRYRKILEDYDLTVTQSNILGIISHFSPRPLALEEIKSMVLEPNADVSRTVVRLEEKGFVKKSFDPANRRKLHIAATAKGVRVSNKLKENGAFLAIIKDFSLKEAKELIRLLAKLRA